MAVQLQEEIVYNDGLQILGIPKEHKSFAVGQRK
jgi:hypothetical protein